MKKKSKVMVIGICVLVSISALGVLSSFISTKNQFVTYLSSTYPKLDFKVGFIKYDIIYGRYYANINCINDETAFTISKSSKDKSIFESYKQNKNRDQYNAKINSILKGSDVEPYIISATGSGETTVEDNKLYSQIDIALNPETENISLIMKILDILKEKNISSQRTMFNYENDKGVYQVILSSEDYGLAKEEIEKRVQKIK